MSVTLPVKGSNNWDVPVNNALTSLDSRITAIESRSVAVPATATSTGVVGQTAYSTTYFYVCVATNQWRRTPLTTW